MNNSLYFITPIDNFYKDLELITIPQEEEENWNFSNKKFSFSNFFFNSASNSGKESMRKGNEKHVVSNESTEISETSSIIEDSSIINEDGKYKITESFKIDWIKCIKIFKKFSRINYFNQIKPNDYIEVDNKIKKENDKISKKLVLQRKKHKKPLLKHKIYDNHY